MPRPWSVLLRADAPLLLDDTIALDFDEFKVRIYTHGLPDADGLLTQALAIELIGEAETLEDAVQRYGTFAAAFIAPTVVFANASVPRADLYLVASEPDEDRCGEFLQRAPLDGARRTPIIARQMSASALQVAFERLVAHEQQARLWRAMEHYAESLRHQQPFTNLMATELLQVAVETLTPVVRRRLLAEADLLDNPEGKHALAVRMGFEPADEGDRKHLYKLDAYIRGELVLRDKQLGKRLTGLSDGLEHGFSEFASMHAKAADLHDETARATRRAILAELGVADELDTPHFAEAMPMWQPVVEVRGSFEMPADVGTQPFPGGVLHGKVNPRGAVVPDGLEATPQVECVFPHGEVDVDQRRWIVPSPGGQTIWTI